MTEAAAAFLGVERSLAGQRWRARLEDERAALTIAQRHGLPEVVGRALAARGVAIDDVPRFLEPTLRDFLPDPAHLKDMDKAVGRLADAIEAGEAVAVFGDYDVDGATSTALLRRYFAALGTPLRVYIPDRIEEGYGPNAPALLALKEEGARLVITVDCGITAFDPLSAATDAGLDMIVVDHHEAEPRLPPAHAVINPNRLDDDSPHGYLAAVGVTFLLVIALNRVLRERGYFAARDEPDLLPFLDLVALGTVCDVVPLVGLNRALAAQGLKMMGRWDNLGLAHLAKVARIDEAPNAYHAGFILGPRINAGGRVGAADLGTRLLTTDDAAVAAEIARRLDELNKERQEIEAATLAEALAQAEASDPDAPLLLTAREGWHPGVIGIVASRLKDRFGRPACVVGIANGEGKGSGRSIPGVDLGAAIIAARQAGLLMNGGGHKMAAGFTVAADRVDDLRGFLGERLSDDVAAAVAARSLGVDGALSVSGATRDLCDLVAQVGPFGVGNPEPRFVLTGARIGRADIVGGDHVRCFLTDGSGGRAKGIAFRCASEPLGEALLHSSGRPLHLAGHLRPDNWQGRRDAQFVIEDAAWAEHD